MAVVTHRFDRSHEHLKPMDDELRGRRPHWGWYLRALRLRLPECRLTQHGLLGCQASRGHIKAQNMGSSDWVGVPCLFGVEQRAHGNAL